MKLSALETESPNTEGWTPSECSSSGEYLPGTLPPTTSLSDLLPEWLHCSLAASRLPGWGRTGPECPLQAALLLGPRGLGAASGLGTRSLVPRLRGLEGGVTFI